jgi:hypothetical protein
VPSGNMVNPQISHIPIEITQTGHFLFFMAANVFSNSCLSVSQFLRTTTIPTNTKAHLPQSAPTKMRTIPENREISERAFGKIAASTQHPLPFRKCMNGVEIRPRLMIAQNKGILARLNIIHVPGKRDFRLPHVLNQNSPLWRRAATRKRY